MHSDTGVLLQLVEALEGGHRAALLPLTHHGRMHVNVSRQLRLGYVVLYSPPPQGVRNCIVYGSGHDLTVVLLHPGRNSRTTVDWLDIDQNYCHTRVAPSTKRRLGQPNWKCKPMKPLATRRSAPRRSSV